MSADLTFDRSGTRPAGRKAGRVPSLSFFAIHPPRQPAISDEGRRMSLKIPDDAASVSSLRGLAGCDGATPPAAHSTDISWANTNASRNSQPRKPPQEDIRRATNCSLVFSTPANTTRPMTSLSTSGLIARTPMLVSTKVSSKSPEPLSICANNISVLLTPPTAQDCDRRFACCDSVARTFLPSHLNTSTSRFPISVCSALSLRAHWRARIFLKTPGLRIAARKSICSATEV